MTREHIESKLREFIDQTVLRGQGSDLTRNTALFELGILDSFAMFAVISFIEREFGVTLRLESLTADDFHDIGSIAGLVQSRLSVAAS